jgi:hypothetical protein
MNSIIKTAANITEELSQANKKSDAKEEVNTTYKRGSKEQMGKQSNAWTVH